MSCVFNQEWFDETISPQFSSWVKPLKDPNRVLCCFCQRPFALINMGKQALESPINGDKHKRNVRVPTVPSKTSVPNSAGIDSDTQASCATAAETNIIPVASQMLTHYVRKYDVVNDEILWALNVTESHFSYNSSRNIVDLLKMMLPDSKIVEK